MAFDDPRVQDLRVDDRIAGVAADEREWALARMILDDDPRPAMRRIEVPVLALFGADDEVVPVAASVDVFRAEVPADLLTVTVLAGGDHRVQRGDPRRLVPGYAETLVEFIVRRGAR